MNKLNSIFKKVAELEKNAQEVKLGMHEVELAIPDKLISTLKNSQKLMNDYVSYFKQIVNLNNNAKELLQLVKNDKELILSEQSRILALVKELGMNTNDLPYLKEAENRLVGLNNVEKELTKRIF